MQKVRYNSLEEYFDINSKIIYKEKQAKQSEKNSISFKVNIKFQKYDEFKRYYPRYYLPLPDEYLENIEELKESKNDIFERGKILRFSNFNLSFDAVVNKRDDNFAYIIPIKKKLINLIGNYTVKERNGDLTYERMSDALDNFVNEDCCSNHIEKYILGNQYFKKSYNLSKIFNYSRYYMKHIRYFFSLNYEQKNTIDKIFTKEMVTINIRYNTSLKVICLIIYALYQMRRYINDKILVCSSSNAAADDISMLLLNMKDCVKKLNILRIYAKNQEKVQRNKMLNYNSFHHILKFSQEEIYRGNNRRKRIIDDHDIIISTCVNSYCDDLINYHFPFVIIVDANNSNENENLIPLTLHAQHVLLIAYENSDSGQVNLYKRMKRLYPANHFYL